MIFLNSWKILLFQDKATWKFYDYAVVLRVFRDSRRWEQTIVQMVPGTNNYHELLGIASVNTMGGCQDVLA